MVVKIDYEKCGWKNGSCQCGCKCSCGSSDHQCCDQVCPVQAITKTDKVNIDSEKCIDCGICIGVCPKDALSL
jgi:Fe-S-cluster-containing hydrogenase component 2